MADDCRVLILFSGRGSNFENLALHQGPYRIVAAITDNPQAAGIAIAKRFSIPVTCLARQEFDTLAMQKREILRAAQRVSPDLICLAGFMQIISPDFLAAFADRVINIHPSLLPKYPGLNTHERVLTAGETTHGCTVHVVDQGVDTGSIIAQAQVQVLAEDTPESLAKRVLLSEHTLYPWVVRNIAVGHIKVSGGKVQLDRQAQQDAQAHTFTVFGGSR